MCTVKGDRMARSRTRRRRRTTAPAPTSARVGSAYRPQPLVVSSGRYWHPEGRLAPPLTTIGARTSLTIGSPRIFSGAIHSRPIVARRNTLWSSRGLPVGLQVPIGIRFESPLKVLTCVRRKVRRAVIFAKGKAGGGPRKRPRRNYYSEIGC